MWHCRHQKRTPLQVKFRSHVSASVQKYNPVNLCAAANRLWICLNSVGTLVFITDFPMISVAPILGMCTCISCWQGWAVLSAPGARSNLGLEGWNWEPLPKAVALVWEAFSEHIWNACTPHSAQVKQEIPSEYGQEKQVFNCLPFPFSFCCSSDLCSSRDVKKARLNPHHLLCSGHSHYKWKLLHLLHLSFWLTLELALLWGLTPRGPFQPKLLCDYNTCYSHFKSQQ